MLNHAEDGDQRVFSLIIIVVLAFLFGLSEDFPTAAGCATFATFASIIVLGVIGAIIIGNPTYTSARIPLINIADNTSVHGDFFLGIGSVDSEPVYSWYERTDSNSYKRFDADASISTIHYINGNNRPYYTEVASKGEHFFHKWVLNLDANGHNTVKRYDFYIPRGSITNEFKLDAQG